MVHRLPSKGSQKSAESARTRSPVTGQALCRERWRTTPRPRQRFHRHNVNMMLISTILMTSDHHIEERNSYLQKKIFLQIRPPPSKKTPKRPKNQPFLPVIMPFSKWASTPFSSDPHPTHLPHKASKPIQPTSSYHPTPSFHAFHTAMLPPFDADG